MPRQVIKFETNQPVQVALEFPDGVNVMGQYGPQVKFSLTENRVMFVAPDVAQAIRTLGVCPGEPFTICKRWEKGRSTWWDVERVKLPTSGNPPLPTSPTISRPAPSDSIHAAIPPDSLAPVRQIEPDRVSASETGIVASVPPRIPPQITRQEPPRASGLQLTKTPPLKPSYEEAFRECLRIVREGLHDAGEAWSDHSVQAMTSTLFIQAAREGTMRFTVPRAEKVA